jgi:hypothetical protein
MRAIRRATGRPCRAHAQEHGDHQQHDHQRNKSDRAHREARLARPAWYARSLARCTGRPSPCSTDPAGTAPMAQPKLAAPSPPRHCSQAFRTGNSLVGIEPCEHREHRGQTRLATLQRVLHRVENALLASGQTHGTSQFSRSFLCEWWLRGHQSTIPSALSSYPVGARYAWRKTYGGARSTTSPRAGRSGRSRQCASGTARRTCPGL